MKTLRGRFDFIEEVLGTASGDPEIHAKFIASKADDAPSLEEEVAALGAEAVEVEKMTVFPIEQRRMGADRSGVLRHSMLCGGKG